MKPLVISFLGCLFVVTSCIVDTSRKNSNTISGNVIDVSTDGKGGEQDITIALATNDTLYYINRGLEEFTLKGLRDTLIGSKISLTYAKNVLQPTYKHITEIKKDDKIVFTEYTR
jgi:hypothetical protein